MACARLDTLRRGGEREIPNNRTQMLFKREVRCGSKSEILIPNRYLPLCPRTRTLLDAVGTSHLCQFPTFSLYFLDRPQSSAVATLRV